MDYSKLSDIEIDTMVSKICSPEFHRNYCRNPADAWPIISGHHISIMYVEALSKWCAGSPYWVDGCEWQLDIDVVNENPLRAAMILFLMIQGDE
ncbi:TPA: DUF2591 family protein [Klebsiella aerogenes]|nr:DUF2591 family protein [Klebsiella aerogenes]